MQSAGTFVEFSDNAPFAEVHGKMVDCSVFILGIRGIDVNPSNLSEWSPGPKISSTVALTLGFPVRSAFSHKYCSALTWSSALSNLVA